MMPQLLQKSANAFMKCSGSSEIGAMMRGEGSAGSLESAGRETGRHGQTKINMKDRKTERKAGRQEGKH